MYMGGFWGAKSIDMDEKMFRINIYLSQDGNKVRRNVVVLKAISLQLLELLLE